MRTTMRLGLIIFTLLTISACGGLRFSQVAPEAKDFHPQRVAVLPADVGIYEESRGTVEQIFTGALTDKKYFKEIVDAGKVNSQIQVDDELRKAVLDYLVKLKTINISDPTLSRKIGEVTKSEAFFVINVDFWNYTKENGDKVGKVGLGIKMVESSTGRIMWKAGHHLSESYWMVKPDLPDIAKELVKKMIEEMPH